MANRFPLVSNKENRQIRELPAGDNLDLSQNGIINAESIQSIKFYGNLVGIASTAINLSSANNILGGIIDPARLDGEYDIDISGTSNNLLRAENILDGIIDPARLDGQYNIDISGTAENLSNAGNILDGIIDPARLSGEYNISISGSAEKLEIQETNSNQVYYPIFTPSSGDQDISIDLERSLSYNPSTNRLGIGTNVPTKNLDVVGNVGISSTLTVKGQTNIDNNLEVLLDVTADSFYGNGANLVGIVTQIIPSIGINIQSTQESGKGVVTIDAYKPIGKTIYVSQNGDDNNTGLAENNPKRTIKAAATVAVFGDTIKVFPGVYVEENPIILKKTVSVEGTELRNCVVTPRYPYLDLFHVNNGCHITDMSFIGPDMTDGASVVALQPLKGVSADRFFDASRMLRTNLEYISREAVGFLTSGFSGFAGNHREQDAARLIDLNIDFIANETVGFLTTGYVGSNNQPFVIVNSSGISTDPVNCEDDIKDILKSISYDLKAGSNRKVIGAGKSYYDNAGTLLHITGTDTNGNSVKSATIDAINYAVGIVTYVINNQPYPATYTQLTQDTTSYSPVIVSGGCTDTVEKIQTLSGIVTSIIDNYSNITGITTIYGVNLEVDLCAKDVQRAWKCIIHDITRGGNSRCVDAGKAYYDENWNLIPEILKNPEEVSQTISTLDYSFNIARAIINNASWGGYPVGLGTSVSNAVYNEVTGITSITAINHNLNKGDAVKIVGLGFTCPSGLGTITYPSGAYGYIFNVQSVIDDDNFEVVVGQSTLPHTYQSGGVIQKYTSFQNIIGQVKDLSIQKDPLTGFNDAITGCSNVVSALHSCVGIITSIIGYGSSAFNPSVGIRTTYPGNSGIGFTTVIGITSAVYDNNSGKTTITATGLDIKRGELIELRDLIFSCSSSGINTSTQIFPTGKYGYEFYIDKINEDESFDVYVGTSTLPHTYTGGGVVVNRNIGVTTADYDNITGITTIKAEGSYVKTGDLITIRGLEFSCPSGSGTTTIYPTGNEGYNFKVLDIVIDKPFGITTALYDNNTGIVTITAPNFEINNGDLVELRGLEFSCSSGAGTTTIYPTGNNGYKFKVLNVVGAGSTFTVNVGPSTITHEYVSGGTVTNRTESSNDTFTIQVGTSTIPHSYVSGGIVIPEYSKGVGPITQGPYVRNCTNFIGKSIGMKIDGFEAEPGDQDDIGVTGTMSVDSYTQYNQGGIGVSITNGAYAQLVSIFTICDDIAIYTGSGGQCDITNSNSSFGRLGLVSQGVGNETTKSIYRHTGIVNNNALAEQAIIEVSEIGSLRPYDGQSLYFGQLYYTVQEIIVENGGNGYNDENPPTITFSPPEGENGINAEALCTVINGSIVSIDLVSSGTQYINPPSITFGDGNQSAKVKVIMSPIYYTIESATLPSSGISTIVLNNNLNNTVSAGTTVYFSRLSLQITSSHSFEWVGSGNDINKAKPALGGVVNQENEVIKLDGGECVYTSTDQAGNFRIGDGVVVNQLTGTISGRAFSQSLLSTVTPLIVALG